MFAQLGKKNGWGGIPRGLCLQWAQKYKNVILFRQGNRLEMGP